MWLERSELSEGRQSCKKLQHMLEQKLQKLQKIKVTQKEVPQIYVKNVQKKIQKKNVVSALWLVA